MDKLLTTYNVPEDKHMLLFTYLRLAASFSNYDKRLKCVQARLQSLSVLIYSNQLTENIQSLLYSGLLEELVEVLEMPDSRLMEIKASALKSLTSIIHLDRNPNFPKVRMPSVLKVPSVLIKIHSTVKYKTNPYETFYS